MIKKKEIDLRSLTIDSYTSVLKQHGLLNEADVVPTLPMKSKLMGREQEESYRTFNAILQPLRDYAGLPAQPSIDQLPDIIEKLNSVLGMSEEIVTVKGKKVGTGLMSSEKSSQVNRASTILSSVYFYRTLYNVLKEQSAIVAGKVLEPVMAVLFLGSTPEADLIQDFESVRGEYVSLKVLSTTEKITGSINNLAIGIAKSDSKNVTYIICRKDQTTEAYKINVYKFSINKDSFLDFICSNLKDSKEGFWSGNINLNAEDITKTELKDIGITSTGIKFLSSVFGWGESEAGLKTLLLKFFGKEEISTSDLKKVKKKEGVKESLDKKLVEAYTQEAKSRELDEQIIYACLVEDPFGLASNPDVSQYVSPFLNQPSVVEQALSGQASKQLNTAIKEACRANRIYIKNELLSGLKKIPTDVINDFNKICKFVFSKGHASKERKEFINDRGEFDIEKYSSFIENTLFPPDSTDTPKIFKSTDFRKNLGDLNELLTLENIFKFPSVSDTEERLTIINFFDDPAKTKTADNELFTELDKLKSRLTNKELEQFFSRPSNNVFFEVYSRIPQLQQLAKGEVEFQRVKVSRQDQGVFTSYLNVLEKEFNKRQSTFYGQEFKKLRQQILLSPFKPLFELLQIVEKHYETQAVQPEKADEVTTDKNTAALRANFINRLFENTDLWTLNRRAGSFEVSLLDLPKKYNIKIEEVGTIFLNEKSLFANAENNANIFNKYMKPVYDNIARVKEKSDQYFLKEDTEAMKDAVLSLKLLEDHINTELKVSPEKDEFKKGEELKESLNNLTEEARIVMEMLKRMEG